MSTVSYLGVDATTLGDWIGNYGTLGYRIVPGSSMPSGVTDDWIDGLENNVTYSTTSTDPRALLHASGDGLRTSAIWYFQWVIHKISGITSPTKVSFYFQGDPAEADGGGHVPIQVVEILDADGTTVLDSRTWDHSVNYFCYHQYMVTGDIYYRMTNTVSGQSAMYGGIFYDAVPTSTPSTGLCGFGGGAAGLAI